MRAAGTLARTFFFYLAALLCCIVVLPSSSHAAAKRSGKHHLNVHTKVKGDPSREVVQGQITSVRENGIVMDGQLFSFTGASLQDEQGAELSYTDIYPGLRAGVVYEAGRIEKIIIFNLSRPVMTRDMKFMQQERSRTLQGK
jgi:hypothetical protein